MYDSVTTYAAAEQLFAKARTPDAGEPVARNTRLFKRGDNYAIQLHDTDVVTFHPEGTVTLNSGGWRTVTTKDRINGFSPASLTQDQGIWYLDRWNGKEWERLGMYEDGMKVSASGRPLKSNKRREKSLVRRKKKVDRLVREYIKGYLDDIKENGLKDPGQGDCFGCLMKADRKPGEADEPMGVDHLLLHFKEKYYVPSLLWKAINEQGFNKPGVIWHQIKGGDDMDMAGDILRQYFSKQKMNLAELL